MEKSIENDTPYRGILKPSSGAQSPDGSIPTPVKEGFVKAGDSYSSLVRLLPQETDDDTYDTLRAQIATDPRLQDSERRNLLQALYDHQVYHDHPLDNGGSCPYCGNPDKYHSPSRDCTGVL